MRGSLNSCLATARGALIATCLLAASPAAARIAPGVTELPALPSTRNPSPSSDRHAIDRRRSASALAEVFTRVLKDPTTYALPPIVYTAHRLDWDSSQKLFAHGYLEANPNFTLSGRVNDVPISHAAGNRRILRYSAAMIGRSALNNGICALVERRLIERSPQRRKLIRTLGWIERGFVTAYWSYRLTHNQVGQWRDNERVLAGLPPPHGSGGVPLTAPHRQNTRTPPCAVRGRPTDRIGVRPTSTTVSNRFSTPTKTWRWLAIARLAKMSTTAASSSTSVLRSSSNCRPTMRACSVAVT